MKIAVTYSSKDGLRNEYNKLIKESCEQEDEPPPTDFFAEGDTPETINALLDALRKSGREVSGVEVDSDAIVNLQKIKPHIVFNIAEGLLGDFRESYIPMVCEKLGIRYTGSDPLTLAICLNKARCKEILSYYGIPNAGFMRITMENIDRLHDFEYPAIIKPNAEGSSKGIMNNSVVTGPDDAIKVATEKLTKYNQPLIVEKFLEGDEFTVALWGNGENIEVLPIVSINYKDLPENAWPIYSYEAKWIWDTPEKPLDVFKCPADICRKMKKKIEKIALDAYKAMGIRDWCRIDVRNDANGNPNILELNPLPGILPKPEDNSCFPKAARTAGYSYVDMINKILDIACERNGLKKTEQSSRLFKREENVVMTQQPLMIYE